MSLVSLRVRQIAPRLSRELHSTGQFTKERDWSELMKRTYGYDLDSDKTYQQSSDLKRSKVNFVAKTAMEATGRNIVQSSFRESLSKNSKLIQNSRTDIERLMNLLQEEILSEIPYHWEGVFNTIPSNSLKLKKKIELHQQLFPPRCEDFDKVHVNIQQHMAKSVEFLMREDNFTSYEEVFTRLTESVQFDFSEARSKLSPQHMLLTHYEVLVAAYLAKRFNRPYNDVEKLMKNNTLDLRTLKSFKLLCDVLLDSLQMNYEQIERVPHLLNSHSCTLSLLQTDPTVRRVFYINCLTDLLMTFPSIGAVEGDDIKKYTKLLDEANVHGVLINGAVVQTFREDRFENVVETLDFFKTHSLDLNSYKSSLFKIFQDPQLLSHLPINKSPKKPVVEAEDPTDAAYKCNVYVPDPPIKLYPIQSYLNFEHLNKVLNCINGTTGNNVKYNEETGLLDGVLPLMKYKETSLNETQRQVIIFLKNKLEASGRKLFEQKEAFKRVTVEDAAYIVHILLKHGFSKKQIRLGLDIFKYDKRLVAKHLPYMKSIYQNYEEEVKLHPQAVNYLRSAIDRSLHRSGPKKV